jgi:hypothetical protein
VLLLISHRSETIQKQYSITVYYSQFRNTDSNALQFYSSKRNFFVSTFVPYFAAVRIYQIQFQINSISNAHQGVCVFVFVCFLFLFLISFEIEKKEQRQQLGHGHHTRGLLFLH